jgi:hypothetical protein
LTDELKARGFTIDIRPDRFERGFDCIYAVLLIAEDIQLDLQSRPGNGCVDVKISNGGSSALFHPTLLAVDLAEDRLLPLLDGLIAALAPLRPSLATNIK